MLAWMKSFLTTSTIPAFPSAPPKARVAQGESTDHDALDQFLSFLDQKKQALQDMKQFWVDKKLEQAEILRSQSPELKSAIEAFPLPTSLLRPATPEKPLESYTLPSTEVDPINFKGTTRAWFESMLSMLRDELKPANQAIQEMIDVTSQQHIAPILAKLRQKEENLADWNASSDPLANKIRPILRQEICSYAIEMLESQIGMLELVEDEVKHCIGWEFMTEALCKQLLDLLDLSVAKLILPNVDFSSRYRSHLYQEITPQLIELEENLPTTEGELKQAQALLLFKRPQKPIAAPQPTHIDQDRVSSTLS